MIIYKDIVSGDEIISDSWKLNDVDDVVYEVDCKMVTLGAENIDIGANPSAEEGGDDLDESTKQVNDVVHSFQLSPMFDGASKVYPDMKALSSQLKTYLKALVGKLKEEKGWDDAKINDFKTKVQGYFMKSIKPNFKDLDIYTGSTMTPEGMLVYLNYREDGVTPYLIIWKHGLSEEKV